MERCADGPFSNPPDPVVLLDEAEVFLQERSLTDLNRNALVSGTFLPSNSQAELGCLGHTKPTFAVFLRTLEYYDG